MSAAAKSPLPPWGRGRAFPTKKAFAFFVGARGWGLCAYLAGKSASPFIAIHQKFQTRRAAEDSTHLYGEAAQHRMRLSVDGYITRSFYENPYICLLAGGRTCCLQQ